MKQESLAIAGKLIDISNVKSKSLAQFRLQLRRNHVEITEEQTELLYSRLTNKEEGEHETN